MNRSLLTAALLIACVWAQGIAALKCYTRSGSMTSENGTSASCTSETACYTYTFGQFNFAGCGSCTTAQTTDGGCRECSTDNCNTQPFINCNVVVGLDGFKAAAKMPCYGSMACSVVTVGTMSSGGCGNCYYINPVYPGCRICTTDYCNNDSQLVASGNLKLAAAAVAMLLALMKLL